MAGATAFCSFGAPMVCIGDELEDQVMRLEAGSSLMFEECWGFSQEEVAGGHAVPAAMTMEEDLFLPLRGLGIGTAPAPCQQQQQQQQQVKQEPSTEPSPTAPIPAGLELGELAKETQRALITAARKNQLAVTMYKTPVQAGAWQGCILSPWCNEAASHLGPCNCKATIPGVSAYAHTAEFADDSGAAHDSDDGTPHGQQADSSAANSGKHGSSATHHTEDGENTSSTGCQGPAINCGWLKASNPGTGSLARSFSAGQLQGTQPIKDTYRAPANKHTATAHLDLAMDTDLPPFWVRSDPALISSNCGEKAQLLGAPPDEQRLSALQTAQDVTLPHPATAGLSRQLTNTAGSTLPSSFVMFNELGGWCNTTGGTAAGQQEQECAGADVQQTDCKPGEQQGGEEGSHSSKRALRPTRSMPNFRSMALGVPAHRVGSTPSCGDARRSMGNHHRWTGSTNGSQARKARASDELSRAAFGPTGLGDLSVVAPVPGQGGNTSGVVVDLASPLSAATPSTATAMPQQVFQALSSVPEDGKQPDAPPKHGHNLRGRAAGAGGHQDGVGLPGTAPGAAPTAPASAPAQPSIVTPANGLACTDGVTGLRISRLPEVPPPQTLGGRKRGAPGTGSTCARPVPHPTGQCCTACGTTVTPVWRAGPQGPKTLCNACGVRYMKVAKKK